MKIHALEIDGYGVWSGLRLERLSGELNVVYGPNEAGKSTLLQFIRSVLYGYSPERRRYFPPVHGGRPGGRIDIGGPSGQFQIDRHKLDGTIEAEQLVVTAGDGTRQGEHVVRVLLSNLDEAVFNNVFAVGLHEIQELGALSDTEAAELLYNLSAGLDRVSIVEVMRELQSMRSRILDPSGGECQATQLLAERHRLRREIDELESLSRRCDRLSTDRAAVDHEIGRLEQEKQRAEQQLRVIDLAAGLRDRWSRRAALDAEIAALGKQPWLRPDAAGRLDALQEKLQHYRRRSKHIAQRRSELRREAAAVEVNPAILRNAARIEALVEQEPWIAGVQSQVEEIEDDAASLRAELAAEHERLGLGRPSDPDATPGFSERALRRLRGPAKALRDCSQRATEAQQQAAAADEAGKALAQQVDAALAARNAKDLSTAIDHAGNLVAQLRRRLHLDERLQQMARHQEELQNQSQDLLDHQVLPVWILAGLGAVFILGLVLLVAGMFMPASMTGSMGWALALLGLIGALAAAAGKVLIEQSNAQQLDACRKQIHLLGLQVQQAKDERDVLDGQLPRGGGPLASRLAAAEQELAALEALAPVETRRASTQQETAAAAARAVQADEELRAAKRHWREALSAARLPENLTPQHVRQVVRRSDRILQVHRRLKGRLEELAARRRELDTLLARVAQVLGDCGIEARGKPPTAMLRQLAETLTQQKAQAERREKIVRNLRAVSRSRGKLKTALRRLMVRRRELFREAGVEDEAEYRRRAADAMRAEALRRDRTAIDHEIAAAAAEGCPEQSLREQLDGAAAGGLEARRDEAAARVTTIERELRDRLEKRGQLAEQMRALAEDRRISERQLDLAVVDQRLETLMRRWQVLAVACGLLEQIRRVYETERQPETLREASGYLDRLTQGRYRRVWTPLGQRELRVEDAEGHSLPVESLSRGTREQLFLSLRLALAAWYARRGAMLPLVLDDVLVNFDTERAKAAAAVLHDFAATGHQLLVFTCHEHIARMFQTLRVPVCALPDNSEPSHAPVVFEVPPEPQSEPQPEPERKPSPPRRRSKPKPPPEPVVEEEPVEEVDEEKTEEEHFEPTASWPEEQDDEPESLWEEDDAEAA